MMFSDLSKCFPHFVKDSKNGNLVGIQEIPFWTIHSKGHDALVFLLPNKYTAAVGQHFCPSREQDPREASRGCRKPQHIFSSGNQGVRPMSSVRARAINSCPAIAVQERGLTGRLPVHVVDDRDSLRARLGEREMYIVEGMLERKGATLILKQAVRAVLAEGIELENGMTWDSMLTPVVGPLRGIDLRLHAPIVDEHGFVLVQPTFQSESQPNFFAVGNAMRFSASSVLPESWMMTQLQAPLVAQNLVAHASSQDLRHFDVDKAYKRSELAILDCGGQTVMVMLKNGRVLASGCCPLLLRAMVDRRSLKKLR
jgi:NADH dehydrogenase FAD-containing subunit